MREFNKVLGANETILWEGRPAFWPFFLGRSLTIAVPAALWVSFFVAALLGASDAQRYYVLLNPYGWLAVAFFLGPPLYNALVFSRTRYAITSTRVILQKGLIGRDFESLDLDQITNIEVRVGFWDKVLGTRSGSILIASAGSATYARRGPVSWPYTMGNVPRPYEILRLLKEAAHDLRTDIQYPNKLRPDENPGYRTTRSSDREMPMDNTGPHNS